MHASKARGPAHRSQCDRHLLGEHRELHAIWAVLTTGKGGYAHHPETLRPTPRPTAARIQRSLAVLGSLNIASGVALVAVNAILAQSSHSRPSTLRALRRSSSPNGRSPLWIGSGIVTGAALADQLRRRLA